MNFPPLKKLINFKGIRQFLPNAKIVMTNGCFDLLHVGHMNFLKTCKKEGDYLIVGLNSDESIKKLKGDDRPILNFEYRVAALENLDCVDFIFKTEERCPFEIRIIKPNLYFKAGDYTINTLDDSELSALVDVNAKINFVPHIYDISTSKIINKIKNGK